MVYDTNIYRKFKTMLKVLMSPRFRLKSLGSGEVKFIYKPKEFA